MLPNSDFVFVVTFRLRAESLASDSDHRFHALEITASQFQLFFRRTAQRQSSSSALKLSQLEKQELPVQSVYFDLAGQHTAGVMHSTTVSRRLQYE